MLLLSVGVHMCVTSLSNWTVGHDLWEATSTGRCLRSEQQGNLDF
jgi:hypothetical protein